MNAKIGGKTGIVGCPCNDLQPYEDFIWGHRRIIMQYISAKVKDVVERALEDEGASDQAVADLEQEVKAKEIVRCPKCLKFVSQIAMKEGGMCVRCWDSVQAEEEAERRRAEEERARQEDERRKREAEEENLPF
jgi:hypothetical protein